MKPINHLIASAVTGGLFYLWSRSFLASGVCFLAGVLIDLDHFCDFFLFHKRSSFNLRKFYASCIEGSLDRLYIFLHSAELIFLLWIAVILGNLNLIWASVAVGVSAHLLLDIVNNNVFPQTYFLIYRLSKGFRAEFFFRDGLHQKT